MNEFNQSGRVIARLRSYASVVMVDLWWWLYFAYLDSHAISKQFVKWNYGQNDFTHWQPVNVAGLFRSNIARFSIIAFTS